LKSFSFDIVDVVEELPKCHICGGQAQLRFIQSVYGINLCLEICVDCLWKCDSSVEDIFMKLFELSKYGFPFSRNVCSCCGMTWKEFWVSGRIGCSRCVEEILPFSSKQGYGKKKRRLAEDFCQETLTEVRDYVFDLAAPGTISCEGDVLSSLKLQLKRAVRKEQFETAAILRDRIRQLEEKRS
jgi:hypothetical protein